MATGHRNGDDGDENELRICVKGAPEAVFALCHAARHDAGEQALDEVLLDQLRASQREMAGNGLRVLAIAAGRMKRGDLIRFAILPGAENSFSSASSARSIRRVRKSAMPWPCAAMPACAP
jgi:magnesium-transporting ATPase (P-type)